MTKQGRYLYAVISASEKQNYEFNGINGARIYDIKERELAAVVSKIPNNKIRPERRHLAAHHEVLRQLLEKSTPLPMSFGIIAKNDSAVSGLLVKNHDTLIEQLNSVADKVEMGLSVTWDVSNIFEYFIDSHLELKEARDRFFLETADPTHEERIELGRMFEYILNEDRERFARQVEDILKEYCFDIMRNKPRSEKQVMNLACLVGKDIQAQKRFEAGVFEAAKLFDNHFAFDYNGPWAPHNFVRMNFKL